MKSPAPRKPHRPTSSAIAAGPTLALPRLSTAASAFIERHPERAALAVTAALEAAATQWEALQIVATPPIPEPLRRFVKTRASAEDLGELIVVEEAARRLQVTRQTVYTWLETRRMIGWQLTRRGMQIPAGQIIGRGELVRGIDRVLEVMPDPRMAWRFLSEESPFFDKPRRPLDVLKKGEIEQVVQAARATGEDFT